MTVVAYPAMVWDGLHTVRVQAVNAQAGDLVCVAFATAKGFTDLNLLNGWNLVGTVATFKGDYFTQDGLLVFVAKRFETTAVVPEDTLTTTADRRGTISVAPNDGLSVQFRGETKLAVKSVTSNRDDFTTISEQAATLANPTVVVYGQTINVTSVGVLEDVDPATGAKTYGKFLTRVATGTQLGTRTRNVVKRVRVDWTDGTVEDKIYPGPIAASITSWTLSAASQPAEPTAKMTVADWFDVTKPNSLSWVYSANLAGPQTGWALKKTSNTNAVSYWNDISKTWEPSEFWNPGAGTSASFPVGSFTANNLPNSFALRVKGTVAGTFGVYGPTVPVSLSPAPTASVTVETGTSGQDTATVRVTPAGTPTAGNSLTAWDMEVSAADNTVVAARTKQTFWTPQVVTLPGVGTYTVKIRVYQSGGSYSEWATQQVTVSAEAPSIPSVTVTQTHHQYSGAPGLTLNVTFPWAGLPFAWADKRVYVRVDRSTEGKPWETVAYLGPYLGRTTFQLTDYAAPSGREVRYRVRGEGVLNASGDVVVGSWSNATTPKALTIECGWILDPRKPEEAVRTELVSHDPLEFDTTAKTNYSIGARFATVSSAVPRAATGGLRVRTFTQEDELKATRVLESNTTLFVRWHREKQRKTNDYAPARDIYLAVVGQFTVDRTRQAPDATREISFKYAEQPAPIIEH